MSNHVLVTPYVYSVCLFPQWLIFKNLVLSLLHQHRCSNHINLEFFRWLKHDTTLWILSFFNHCGKAHCIRPYLDVHNTILSSVYKVAVSAPLQAHLQPTQYSLHRRDVSIRTNPAMLAWSCSRSWRNVSRRGLWWRCQHDNIPIILPPSNALPSPLCQEI